MNFFRIFPGQIEGVVASYMVGRNTEQAEIERQFNNCNNCSNRRRAAHIGPNLPKPWAYIRNPRQRRSDYKATTTEPGGAARLLSPLYT